MRFRCIVSDIMQKIKTSLHLCNPKKKLKGLKTFKFYSNNNIP